jgi:hypothetical protein
MSSPLDHFSLERPDRREQLTCGAGSQLEAVIEAMEMALKQLYAMRGAQEPLADAEPAVHPVAEPEAFGDDDLIELHKAAKRFDVDAGKIRRWCRTHDIGRKRGGRWMVSIRRIRKHLSL